MSKANRINKQRRFGYQHRRNSVLRVRVPVLLILIFNDYYMNSYLVINGNNYVVSDADNEVVNDAVR